METNVEVMGEDAAIRVEVEAPSHVADQGRGFVFLHGITSDRDEYLGLYRTLARALADIGHVSIRFDFAGHGKRATDPENLNLGRMVREAAGCLNHLRERYRVTETHLMGTSFGGPPAIAAAVVYPELVSRLTLLAPASDYSGLYLDPVDPDRQARYRGLREKTLFEGLPFHLTESVQLGPALAFEFATVDIRSLFARLRCPIAVFHGDADGVIPVDWSRLLAASNERAEFFVLPDTEHGFTKVGDEVGDDPRTRTNLELILATLAERAA